MDFRTSKRRKAFDLEVFVLCLQFIDLVLNVCELIMDGYAIPQTMSRTGDEPNQQITPAACMQEFDPSAHGLPAGWFIK